MLWSTSNPLTKPTTVFHPPMYFEAPLVTPKITGAFSSCASSRIAEVHSTLLMLNCPTA